MIEAAIFDLDDTLYPQADWLGGAWGAVADAAPSTVDRDALLDALIAIAAEGSARGGIIDRALERVAPEVYPAPLVAAFKAFRSGPLQLYPGVQDRLVELRRHVKLAIITDGAVAGQQDKVDALGIAPLFDVITYSDVFGRSCRKPHPMPFETTLSHLGVDAERAVMVGDRSAKDIAGASRVGIRPIRVRTGEYADEADVVEPWMTCATAAEALDALLAEVGADVRV